MKSQDLWAGVMFAGIGLAALFLAFGYQIGRPERMGPGFFPAVVGGLLVLTGLALAVRGLLREGTPVELMSPRVFVAILSVVAFALLIRPAGLIVAVVACVLISSGAGRGVRIVETLVLTVVLTAGVWLVFRVGLGIPIPVWPF